MLKILLYLRAVFLLFFIVIHTAYCSVIVITLLFVRAPRWLTDKAIGGLWCGPLLYCCGIEVELTGAENVPKDKGFLYLFTHSSHLDIPVLFNKTPKSFNFGAKTSLFKIPIFGDAIRLAGTLPITRDDRDKVIEVYRQAEKRVQNGEAFALAPEGGRRSGGEIKDFKSGPFIFAINAKMPLVPVVLCGLDLCLKKGSLLINTDRWKRKVGMSILPAIDVSNIPIEQMKELKEKVRTQMVNEHDRMKQIYT